MQKYRVAVCWEDGVLAYSERDAANRALQAIFGDLTVEALLEAGDVEVVPMDWEPDEEDD